MVYRSCELNQRVTLQKEVTVSDGMGGSTKTWTTVETVWAHVRPLRGNERIHSERLQAEGGYLVVIRYQSDVSEAWRIVWRNKAMNIRFVQDNGPRDLFLSLECDKGVAT